MFQQSTRPLGGAIFIDQLRVGHGVTPLIQGLNMAIHEGDVVAVVGPNGSGKSTLLQIIASAGNTEPDNSTISFSGGVSVRGRVAHLAQEIRMRWELSVGGWCDELIGPRATAWRRYEHLLGITQDMASLEQQGEWAVAIESVAMWDAWDVDEELDAHLMGLGCSPQWRERAISELSGGEVTRVALAALLCVHADVMILDEPTNHLDAQGRDYLVRWILSLNTSAVLMASHDRAFIDACGAGVLAIDSDNHTVGFHPGGYGAYVLARDTSYAAAQREFEARDAKRRALLAAAGALSTRATSFNAISANDFQRSKSKKAARQSTTLRRRIERTLEDLSPPRVQRTPAMIVAQGSLDAPMLLRAYDLGFERDEKWIFRHVNLDVPKEARIAVRGRNGSGKSTLLDIIGKELAPAEGTLRRTPGVKVGYLRQTPLLVSPRLNVVEAIRRQVPCDGEELAALLGATLFRNVAQTRVGELSVGELRRCEAAALFSSGCDLLLLDEVTNHLDITTIEAVEQALVSFRGAVILVSHDENLLDALQCERVLTFFEGCHVEMSMRA